VRRRPAPPPRRLRSSEWRSAAYVSLDFEATGLDPARDRIVSIGAVAIIGGRVEAGDAVYQLVDPGDRIAEHRAVTVHGIRPVDLAAADPPEVVARSLRPRLDGRFLVAWHAWVEAGFLARLFGTSSESWRRRSIDTRDMLLTLEGEVAASWTLTEAAEHLGVPVTNPHHALDDAIVTAQLFVVAVSKLERREGRLEVGDLLRMRPSSPPVLRRPRAPM
jgi:DNA polymerase III subunit epsilon